jgi:Protein of unknown function (DUF3710)
VRFRRKKDGAEGANAPEREQAASSSAEEAAEPPAHAARAQGPYDVSEVDDDVERVDLGSLLITPEEGRELRLQVDEATQVVQSVLIAGDDGAVEIRAFAAPRNGDLWSDARPQIKADAAQRGSTTSEREGRFGVELMMQQQVQLPDGNQAIQPSRIVGINGPRWFLRATFLGKPAMEPDAAESWEDTLAAVLVNRGSNAMPPGDPLPLTLPSSARRAP